MPIKTAWLLFLIAALAVLGYFNYISWEVVVGFFIVYVFLVGLQIEFKEIKEKENLRGVLTGKIENIEKSIGETLQKIDSDSRIKDRIIKRKKEVIEWLNKL